jgi:para-nitrobenzyl esterase
MLELPYLFRVRYLTPATQRTLSDFMIDRWTHFARTGKTGWPSFRDGQ